MNLERPIDGWRIDGEAAIDRGAQETWQRLGVRLGSLRASTVLWLSGVRRSVACVLFGHEKWTSIKGDWHCMHCSGTGQVPVLVSTDRGVRRELSAP